MVRSDRARRHRFQPGDPGPTVLGPLFDSSFYLIENWLPGLLRVAFGSENPAAAYASTLEALRCEQSSAESADADDPQAEAEPEPELTNIEQEVARLLADRDVDAESPPAAGT